MSGSNSHYNFHNNPYTKLNKVVPQSVVYNNNTPRKQTLIRNQSFQNRQYNEDLIQLIGKIRSLQDDLLNQRFKNQSLERKLVQYEKIIDNMEYQLTTQSYQLSKLRHEVQLSNEKNIEILKYEQNLKYINVEIEQLNNVLITKSKEYDNLYTKYKNRQFQTKKIQEENHLWKVNHNIWFKQLDGMIQQWGEQKPSQSGNIPNSKMNNSNRSNKSQGDDLSLSFVNLSEQIHKKFDNIREFFNSYLNALQTLEKQSQKTKKQMTIEIIKQKQKYIKLQYEYKLSEQRSKDLGKRQDLVALCYNDKKAQQIIEQMLKKQDQYVTRIEQCQRQKSQLRDYVKDMQNQHNFTYKIQLQQKLSIINNLKQQNNLLSRATSQLQQKLQVLEARYEQTQMESIHHQQTLQQSTIKQHQSSRIQLSELGKRNRRLQQQNYEYKIKIEQLIGQMNVLQKQIEILKANEE